MKGIERERNEPRASYFRDDYFKLLQMASLTEQFVRIRSLNPTSVLEIGPGNGLLAAMLRHIGIAVTTVDVNPSLTPDIVCDIHELPMKLKQSFDLVVCCEVLEHMPFENFPNSIEVFTKFSSNLFLTLPYFAKHFGVSGILRFPKIEAFSFGLWMRTRLFRELPSEHCWEVNYTPDQSTKNIRAVLEKHYANIEVGRFPSAPYHTFFNCVSSRKN